MVSYNTNKKKFKEEAKYRKQLSPTELQRCALRNITNKIVVYSVQKRRQLKYVKNLTAVIKNEIKKGCFWGV